MNWFKVKLNNTMAGMQEAIRDDNMRKELMFGWLNVLLALDFAYYDRDKFFYQRIYLDDKYSDFFCCVHFKCGIYKEGWGKRKYHICNFFGRKHCAADIFFGFRYS